MGFIYTGFRPSHFEVMVVTDIKLVFIQILSHAQVTETMIFSSLQLSSYIPNWGLQKNAEGHISRLGDLWYERELTTPENTITHHNALCLSPRNFV